jgi:hypothetical protein
MFTFYLSASNQMVPNQKRTNQCSTMMYRESPSFNSAARFGSNQFPKLMASFFRIEFISDIKSLEHERLLKEQERTQIACRGIKCVTEACIPRLKDFHAILTKTDNNV